jgi:predicted transcriptional regulator
MTRADDYILEFLSEKDILATPRVISANIDYSHQYVNERMKPLREQGLIETEGDGIYRITEKGEAYLAGEIDEDDLEG